MANPFTSINCVIRYDNARIVSWTMKPGANYPEDFILQVENSRAGGPWEILASDVSGMCSWVDNRRRNYNKRLNECYRIRMIVPSTGEEWVSDIVDAGNHKAYPYSSEAENVIKQVENAIEISGCSGKLLKKKLWGVRCPLCVDFANQQTVNEHCPRCLGTGIDGGYFPGIVLNVIKDSIQTNEMPSNNGYLQGETVQARCIAYPWINYGDVWVEDESNNRYVIAKVTPTASYKQTHLVYTLVMNKVEYNDVLHSPTADRRVVDTGMWEEKERPLPQNHTYPGRARDEWDALLEENP